MTTPNTTAARKTYRTADATGTAAESNGRPGAPKPKSVGRQIFVVLMFLFGVWRLTVGVMTLIGPSTTTHTYSGSSTPTTSFCDTTPTPRGC